MLTQQHLKKCRKERKKKIMRKPFQTIISNEFKICTCPCMTNNILEKKKVPSHCLTVNING